MARDRINLDRIEINDSNAQAILKSSEVLSDLMRRGGAIAAGATAGSPDGAQFYVDRAAWGARNAVFITTGNHAAREGEARTRALTRALGDGQ
jgi:hypothetical protein